MAEFREFNSRRHIKNSLAELMNGKKTTKSLPPNFFEKVLELEIKLKRGFNMQVLQELVNYYSCAIEYYESINDPKYKDYQTSLNLLLTQPDILKRMNKIGKKEEENNPVAYAKTVKKEIARKQVKVKSDFMATTQNDKQVKNLMKEAEKPKEAEKIEKIENILSNQISSQSEVFRKKLEEKRKKTMLSTSDINDTSDLKHKRLGGSVSRNQNRSILSDGDRIDITPPDLYGDGELPISMNHVNLNEYNGNNPIEPNLLQCLDNSFDRVDKDRIDEIDVGISFDMTMNTSSYNQKINRLRSTKQMRIFSDLKKNMDNFLTDFNYYFFEEVFQTVVLDIEKILEEKHKQILDISKNYNDQIKEYEFLMTSDTDGTYKESFNTIITQLKDEMQLELEKLDDFYDQKIKENKKKYKCMGLNSNNGIQVIEEKFKLDMFNLINDLLNPKVNK